LKSNFLNCTPAWRPYREQNRIGYTNNYPAFGMTPCENELGIAL